MVNHHNVASTTHIECVECGKVDGYDGTCRPIHVAFTVDEADLAAHAITQEANNARSDTAMSDIYRSAVNRIRNARIEQMESRKDRKRGIEVADALKALQGLKKLYEDLELSDPNGKSSGADHAAALYELLNSLDMPVP